jgi:hypothetical protein
MCVFINMRTHSGTTFAKVPAEQSFIVPAAKVTEAAHTHDAFWAVT